MCACWCVSHVALSQSFVDRQQAGDLLDDDLPRQFDGTAAVVHAVPLRLKAPGFLTDTDRRKETAGPVKTEHQLINCGPDRTRICSHCESESRFGPGRTGGLERVGVCEINCLKS